MVSARYNGQTYELASTATLEDARAIIVAVNGQGARNVEVSTHTEDGNTVFDFKQKRGELG